MCTGLKGRLKSSVSFWASTLVYSPYHFARRSDSFARVFLSNNLSAPRHPGFVLQAISELLGNSYITEYRKAPFALNRTGAKSKVLRLEIDRTHVYCHFVRFKFKYEDLRSLS